MSSRTTVQLDRHTKELLDRVKREKRAKTYAEAIRMLARDAMKLGTSQAGSLPKLRPFERESLDRLD